jgi:MFS family permease
VAALLCLLAVISYVDRQILSLIVEDLHRDLGITDAQYGLLAGPAFIGVYLLVSLPLSAIVDRGNRRLLVASGAIFWSSMTAVSAFATSFTELVSLRACVAIGEAVLLPGAISIIGDLFDRQQRRVPSIMYMVSGPVGASGSVLVGAAILQVVGDWQVVLPRIGLAEPWRLMLLGVAIPGIVVALVLLLVTAGHAIERVDSEQLSDASPDETFVSHLMRLGGFYGIVILAGASMNMVSINLVVWSPTHLIRAFGWSKVEVGYVFGLAMMASHTMAVLLIPGTVTALERRGRKNALYDLATAAAAVSVIAVVIGGFARGPLTCIAAFSIGAIAIDTLSMMPILTIQQLTPSRLRGRMAACAYIVIGLMSSGLGPTLVPIVSTKILGGNDEAIGAALALVAIGAGAVSILLLLLLRARRGVVLRQIRRAYSR